MGKARDAYGLVLAGLRRRLDEGEIGPGRLLSIGELASDFRTSTTPVREALSRLTGEGLLGGARRSGVMRPRLDAEALRDLYDLHHAQVAWALQGGVELFDLEAAKPGGSTEAMFESIVVLRRNRALLRAHVLTAQALRPARLLEAAVLGEIDAERKEIAAALAGGSAREAASRIEAYHGLRRSICGRLAAAIARRWED